MYSADCFIIPNDIYTFGTNELTDNMFAKRIQHFGYTPKKGDLFVQIWTVSPERPEDNLHSWSENWAGHGMPQYIEDKFQWPTFIPLSMLPKEEGGTQKLVTVNGDIYELTARQLKYRYCRFGEFQEVLEKLLNAVVKS